MVEVRTVSVATFVIACIATTVGIVISVAFLTFNIFHRRKRFIKMSSPKLNVMISGGGLSLNIACLMYGMDYFLAERYSEATVTCQVKYTINCFTGSGIVLLFYFETAYYYGKTETERGSSKKIRLWLTTIGVTLVFAPMFAKAWRVHQIFQNAGVKRVVIKDSKLFVMSALFLLVDIVVLTLWQSIDTMKSRNVQYLMLVNQDNPSNQTATTEYILIQECSSRSTSVWLSIIFIWKTCLLGYGLYLAWKTRNVMLPAMRDSASMIISILVTLLLTAPTIMLTSLLRHSPDAIYVTEILLITICATVVQISLFTPKVHFWWKSPVDNPIRMSTSTYDAPNNLKNDNPDEEMFQLVTENISLKRVVTEKSSQIKKLQNALKHAKGRISKLSLESNGKLDSGLDIDSSLSSAQEEESHGVINNTQTTLHITQQSNSQLLTTPVSQDVSSDNASVQSVQKSKKKTYCNTMASTPDIHITYENEDRSDDNDDNCINNESSVGDISDQSSKQNKPFSREGTWVYDSIRSRQDIAGSVAKCYDLEDNEDNFSYVSSYLRPSFPKRSLEYSLRNSTLCISAESVSAIGNDRLYPYPVDSSDSQNELNLSGSKKFQTKRKFRKVKTPQKDNTNTDSEKDTNNSGKSYYL